MTDTISAERQSALMGRIRGAGNESTEVALAKILRQEGLSGSRRQQHMGWALPSLPPRLRSSQQRHRFRAMVALFVDAVLCHLGWTVLRVWEHELERPDRLARWLVRNV